MGYRGILNLVASSHLQPWRLAQKSNILSFIITNIFIELAQMSAFTFMVEKMADFAHNRGPPIGKQKNSQK